VRRISTLTVLLMAAGCGAQAREAAPTKCVVRVYFCTGVTCDSPATKAEEDAARARFRARDDVWSVRFIPKAEALRRMRKRHPDLVPMLPSNPLPDALVVRPVKGVEQRRIATTVREGQGGVERVKLTPGALCAGD
jgi:cell division protein FtsX